MSLLKSLTILDIHPTGFLSVWFGKGPITRLKIVRKIIVLIKTVFAINFFYSYKIKTETEIIISSSWVFSLDCLEVKERNE